MKCIKCGGEVLAGNSRVIKRNGRSLRQHRVCPERTVGSVDKNQQARSPATQSSEPRPANQASVSRNQTVNYRYYIMKSSWLHIVELSSRALTRKSFIEIQSIDAEFADAHPDMLEGFVEIKVGGE